MQYPVEYEQSCHGLLSCKKSEVKTKIDRRIETTVKKVERRVCCPGYAESPERLCLPICFKSCNSGKCVAPNECECGPQPSLSSPGYVGSHCNRFVCQDPGRWGVKCDRECDCPSNSYCSAATGKCLCRAGWKGTNCTEVCTSLADCDNPYLPASSEPEANIIHETTIRDRSQNLNLPEALERSAVQIQEDENKSSSEKQFYSIQSMIYLIVIAFLLYTVIYFWYKFEKLKALVYNQAHSYGYASSIYSAGSERSSSNDTNGGEPKYATLEKGTKRFVERYLIHPKVESHLVQSHQCSKQNLYSDIGSSIYVSLGGAKLDSSSSPGRIICQSPSSNTQEHDYQVPRSPTSPKPVSQDIMSRPLPQPNGSPDFENLSNIYEEINPKAQSQK